MNDHSNQTNQGLSQYQGGLQGQQPLAQAPRVHSFAELLELAEVRLRHLDGEIARITVLKEERELVAKLLESARGSR